MIVTACIAIITIYYTNRKARSGYFKCITQTTIPTCKGLYFFVNVTTSVRIIIMACWWLPYLARLLQQL